MHSLFNTNLIIIFYLQTGTFSNGTNTKACQGLRMSATVDGDAPPKGFSATASIFGMNRQDMDLIVSTSRVLIGNAEIEIIAGDGTNELATIFTGWIYDARVDYNNQPNVSLNIFATALSGLKSMRYKPISYKNPVNCEDILEGLAIAAGLGFQNEGVHKEMSNLYLSGSIGDNIEQICFDKNIRYNLEGKTLHIWGDKREIPIPVVNVKNGLVSYPTATVFSVDFMTKYNPNIKFGGQVKLESSIPQASGILSVLTLTHSVSSELPNGEWFTAVHGWYNFSNLNVGVQ